jgi:hypothetical protein
MGPVAVGSHRGKIAAGSHRGKIAGYDVVRIGLGLVLLLAAALEAHQLATEPVMGAGILRSRVFLIGVVEFELFFGLWLLAGIYARLTWVAAVACFALFAAVALWKALSGEASCGCFGRVPVNPWYTFGMDTFFVAALFYFRPTVRSVPTTTFGRIWLRLAGVVVIWVAIGIPATIAVGSFSPAAIAVFGRVLGNSSCVVVEPETWIGKPFPLLPYIDIAKKLAQGKWTVVLYHYDCPQCRKAALKYEQMARKFLRDGRETRVAMVEMPPYGSRCKIVGADDSACVYGRLSDAIGWFAATPVEIDVEDGRVISAEAQGWFAGCGRPVQSEVFPRQLGL